MPASGNAVDRSLTVTTTSQEAMPANPSRYGYEVWNDASVDVWVRMGTPAVASAGGGNKKVAANGGRLFGTGDVVDQKAMHIICKLDGKVVATGRLTIQKGWGKVERIAVLEGHRGKGIGKMVTLYLIKLEKERDVKGIYAHIQTYAVDFYKKLGFQLEGEIFVEAGIDHYRAVLGD